MDREEVDRVRAMPGFEAHLRRVAENWRPRETDDLLLAQSLRDLGRFVAGLWSLFLDATPGGITLSRMGEILEVTGVSGVGRARSLMIFLRFVGYIEPDPGAGDTRTRVFRPTSRMKAAFLEHYRREFAGLDPLDPGLSASLGRINDPERLAEFMGGLGELTLAAMQLRGPGDEPGLDALSHRYAGMMVLGEFLVAASTEDTPFPPVGTARFSVTGLARRAGISRTQLRRIIKAGAEAGFFEILGEGEVGLTQHLAWHMEMLSAGVYLIHRESQALSLRTLNG